MDRVMELKSISEAGYAYIQAPFPSPLTPDYVKLSAARKRGGSTVSEYPGDVEDACRSFENYLVEMIIEEGKMRDLVDVEELLQCWKNLNLLFSSIWYADSMENYAGICSPTPRIKRPY